MPSALLHDTPAIKLHRVHSLTPQLQHISEDQHPVLALRCAKSPTMAAPTAPAEATRGFFSSFGFQPWDHVTPWLANSNVLPI